MCACIPLLHWTELDIWRYTKRENIPDRADLYFAKNGKRYRSLGDKDITLPVDSERRRYRRDHLRTRDNQGSPERSGRAMDHEIRRRVRAPAQLRVHVRCCR